MIIFDIETDGLDAKKIHVFSWSDGEKVQSTKDYAVMVDVISNASAVCGHNIVSFDLPVLERLTGAVPKGSIIDTLALSWYLYPSEMRHGLAQWGERLGIAKPKIEDWVGLSYEEYKHRCEEDVKINELLWKKIEAKLGRLYKDGHEKLLAYLTFKMQCIRDQEKYQWKLDVEKAQRHLDELEQLKEKKQGQLAEAMPKRIITAVRTPPKNMYKKDGTLSSHGERWKKTLAESFMPSTTMTPVTVTVGTEEGNPNSVDQTKDWLLDLGWKPKTFKYIRGDNYGEERKIPQVRKDGDLCQSVKDLIKVEPAIELLDGLTVATHRIGILKGFIENHVGGYLTAGAQGLTNTFRFRHRNPLVNLPGLDKPFGEYIRGSLIAREGMMLVGCDMVSLEDTTKRHWIQPLDPEYVAEMQQEGFDPHLDLAKNAGAVTQSDIDDHVAGRKNLTSIRKGYKAANYACVYGIGEVALSRSTGLPKAKCKQIIKSYWERNWAVKKVAEAQRVKEVEGNTWIFNPVSGFWHELRYDKDRWSTINQSTGVYVFDTFVALCRQNGLKIIGQFHDEIIVETGNVEETTYTLDKCCVMLNEKIKLNVPFGIDYQSGNNYGEIH
tara:strand:- start:1597 stop:3420 length:1824 start_codon:yes stop_codon:yes gene_type:complete